MIIIERTKETSIYLQRVGLFLPPPSPVLANIHDVLRFFFHPEHAERTLLVQCRSIKFDAGPC